MECLPWIFGIGAVVNAVMAGVRYVHGDYPMAIGPTFCSGMMVGAMIGAIFILVDRKRH